MLLMKKVLWALGLALLILSACGDDAEANAPYKFVSKEDPMIFLPFRKNAVVRIPQGNFGTFTHKGKYAYAYDFDMGDTQNNSSNLIFGEDVLSPVNGTVVSAVHDRSDFTCSGSTCNGGWGNAVVIKPDGVDYYLRLNHLKYNSVPSKFRVGRSNGSPVRVKQGEKVGEVGSTGISTHPHLDMSLVTDYNTGNYESIKFDFVEGKGNQYAWLVSELEEKKAVLDNSGRVNLGAPVTLQGLYTNTTNWGSYNIPEYSSYSFDYGKTYYPGSHIHDTSFYYAFEHMAWVAWSFSLKEIGRHDVVVEANCYESGQMSDNVYYYWVNDYWGKSKYVSQKDGINHIGFHEALFYEEIYGNRSQTIYMQNRSSDDEPMCVDSLILYLDPS